MISSRVTCCADGCAIQASRQRRTRAVVAQRDAPRRVLIHDVAVPRADEVSAERPEHVLDATFERIARGDARLGEAVLHVLHQDEALAQDTAVLRLEERKRARAGRLREESGISRLGDVDDVELDLPREPLEREKDLEPLTEGADRDVMNGQRTHTTDKLYLGDRRDVTVRPWKPFAGCRPPVRRRDLYCVRRGPGRGAPRPLLTVPASVRVYFGCRAQCARLSAFVGDARIPIHNTASEAALRIVALAPWSSLSGAHGARGARRRRRRAGQ
jgi:hypothetical protein